MVKVVGTKASHLQLVGNASKTVMSDSEASAEVGATSKTGGTPPRPPIQDPSIRKFKAKRVNEQIKSFYSLANTIAAAIIVSAYVLPTIKGECGPNELDRPGWVFIGLLLHMAGQAAIRFATQKEE